MHAHGMHSMTIRYPWYAWHDHTLLKGNAYAWQAYVVAILIGMMSSCSIPHTIPDTCHVHALIS